MPKEQDGSGLLTASDRAIYQYLDEMLSDPEAGPGNSAFKIPPKKEPPKPALKDPIPPEPKPEAKKAAAKPAAKPLKVKEKPEPKLLAESPTIQAEPETLPRETMLGFEKPIVVQQPPVTEKVISKPAVKPPAAEIEKPPAPVKKEALKAPEPVKEKEVIKEPEPATEQEPVIDPDSVMGIVEDKEGRLPPITPWCDNGRPEWAQSRFECLLFKVGGLKLAVPLVTLGAIHQIDRKFNNLPGQLDWFIGILQTNVGNIKVMDTALCVMPEKYDASSREELNYVITIHGFEWGISCHEILKSVTLEPEDVKWRSERGKRPWLAGTVVDQMCALVDTAGFHHVIHEAENRKKNQ